MTNHVNDLKTKIRKINGRPKGSCNKNKFDLFQLCKEKNINVFEILLMIAGADWKGLGYESEVYHSEKPDGSVKMGYVISPEMRLHAAKEACKYLYPQLRSVEMSGNVDLSANEKEVQELTAKLNATATESILS